MRVSVCVWVWERESACVRESMCERVCVYVRERERERECVCVCEREKHRERDENSECS